MSPVILGQPLGPDAIQDRMAQLSQELGINSPATVSEPTSDSGFPGALQGAIGGDGASGGNGYAPVIPGFGGTQISNAVPANLKSLIQSAALNNGLDPALLTSLVEQESDFNPNSRSSAGAMGLTQLMPGTAASLGVTSPFDPVQNLNGGAKYLKQLMTQFGSLPIALAAYNAGPNAVTRHGGIPPYPETQAYVRNILAKYEGSKNR